MADEVWGPNMLVALKDGRGRRKLADLRPPTDSALDDLPVMSARNSEGHTWQLIGRSMMNSPVWDYTAFADRSNTAVLQPPRINVGTPWGLVRAEAPVSQRQGPALDGLLWVDGQVGPLDGDNVDLVGPRERRFSARQTLEPLDALIPPNPGRVMEATQSGKGTDWRFIVGALTRFLLEVYEEGPMHGYCTVGRSLAETLEEGDYAVVDTLSVKIANPATEARSGLLLVIILSLTRHPAHADVEYLVVRPVFVCPVRSDPWTWLQSGVENGTKILLLPPMEEPPPGTVGLVFYAFKDQPGGHQIDLTVGLYEGGTLIEETTVVDLPAEENFYGFSLTQAQRDGITNWGNLQIWITRGGDEGGPVEDHRRAIVTSVHLHVPTLEDE
jgi:hypothetical protein